MIYKQHWTLKIWSLREDMIRTAADTPTFYHLIVFCLRVTRPRRLFASGTKEEPKYLSFDSELNSRNKPVQQESKKFWVSFSMNSKQTVVYNQSWPLTSKQSKWCMELQPQKLASRFWSVWEFNMCCLVSISRINLDYNHSVTKR